MKIFHSKPLSAFFWVALIFATLDSFGQLENNSPSSRRAADEFEQLIQVADSVTYLQEMPILPYAYQALVKARSSGKARWLGQAYFLLGQAYRFNLLDYHGAEEFYKKAIPLLESSQDYFFEGRCFIGLGALKVVDDGDLAARELFLEANRVFDKGDAYSKAFMHENLAYQLIRDQEFDSAKMHLSRAIDILTQHHKINRKVFLINNAIPFFAAHRDINKAEALCSELQSIAEKYPCNWYWSVYFTVKGNLLKTSKNYSEALACYMDALSFAEKIKYLGVLGVRYRINLADCYAAMNANKMALKWGLQGMQFALTSRVNNYVAEQAHKLSDLYEREGKLDSSIYYLKVFNQLNNKLVQAGQAKLSQVEASVLLAQKTRQNELLKSENRLQNTILITSLAICALSIALGLVSVLSWRKLKQSNSEIKNKNSEISALMYEMEALNDELSRSNKGLESSVNEKTRRLRNSYRALIKSQKNLGALIYHASHGLKGPLTSIEGLVNLAQAEDKTTSPSLKYLSLIRESNNRMLGVLNKLIMAYEGIAHTLKPQLLSHQDINQLLQHVQNQFEPRIEKKRLEIIIQIQSEIAFVSDPNHLQSIIYNLFENAIVFSEAKNHPKIEIKVSQHERALEIVFRDNGEGIAEKFQRRVFDIFFRASNKSGAGIGLFIVKNIVEKLEGEIHLDSREGLYTEFTIRLTELYANKQNRKRIAVNAVQPLPVPHRNFSDPS